MSSGRRDVGPFPWRVHPIWRGVGCILMVLIPIIAYGLTGVILTFIQARTPDVANYLENLSGTREYLLLIAGMTLLLSIVLYLVFSIIGSFFYSLSGGHRDEELAHRTKRRPFRR